MNRTPFDIQLSLSDKDCTELERDVGIGSAGISDLLADELLLSVLCCSGDDDEEIDIEFAENKEEEAEVSDHIPETGNDMEAVGVEDTLLCC